MGDETANVKQLRNGELHIATLFNGNLTPFAPSVNALVLPYLFSNLNEAYAVLSDESFTNMLADRRPCLSHPASDRYNLLHCDPASKIGRASCRERV